MSLTQEQRERLLPYVPEAYRAQLDELRVIALRVQVAEDSTVTVDDQVIAAAVTKAAPSMRDVHGRPTILKVVAWMCHGDAVNANGDAFVGTELQALADGLFQAPNFGVMDWNHSAVSFWADDKDPKVIGVWYGAQWLFDEKAQLWGLLATGMVFAWLFPEQTDALLADQVRNGAANFSMACIPQSVEFGALNGQQAKILHNPTFFTVSALDKPPADPHAKGRVTEEADKSAADLQVELLHPDDDEHDDEMDDDPDHMALAGVTVTTSTINVGQYSNGGITWVMPVPPAAPPGNPGMEDVGMTQEELDAMEAVQEQVATLVAELEALKDQRQDTRIAELEALVAARDVSLAEVTTSRDALATELAELKVAFELLQAEKITVDEQLKVHADAQAAQAVAEKLAARMAELPEAFLEAHAKRDDEARKNVEAKWAAMSDDEWEFHKTQELLFGFTTKVGYVQRSKAEGTLVPGAADTTIASRVARLIKHR